MKKIANALTIINLSMQISNFLISVFYSDSALPFLWNVIGGISGVYVLMFSVATTILATCLTLWHVLRTKRVQSTDFIVMLSNIQILLYRFFLQTMQ